MEQPCSHKVAVFSRYKKARVKPPTPGAQNAIRVQGSCQWQEVTDSA
jgi:hypothetical protein